MRTRFGPLVALAALAVLALVGGQAQAQRVVVQVGGGYGPAYGYQSYGYQSYGYQSYGYQSYSYAYQTNYVAPVYSYNTNYVPAYAYGYSAPAYSYNYGGYYRPGVGVSVGVGRYGTGVAVNAPGVGVYVGGYRGYYRR